MNLIPRSVLTATPVAAVLTLAVAVGASAQVASLAGPDETPVPEAETSETVLEFEDREEALLAYAQCMRDNGVEMDDPDTGAGGGRFLRLGGGDGRRQIDRFGEGFLVAQAACGSILEAARPEVDPAAEQERLEEQLLLAQCIRDAGYPEYPDPTIGEDGRLQRSGGRSMNELGIDPRSEEFRGLMQTCRDEIGLEQPPGGPGGFGGGRGGG